MEEHEAVEVGVVGVEEAGGVESVVVLDERADFHLMADPIFHDAAEWVGGCSVRQGKL